MFAGPLSPKRPESGQDSEAQQAGSLSPRLGGSLPADIQLLGELLGEAIEESSGSTVPALEERSRALAQSFRAGHEQAADELAALVADVSLDDAEVLIRAFTKYFQLVTAREDVGLDFLQEMRRSWPFFATLLANAEMALAKADLRIAERYAALVADETVRERIWSRITDEHGETVRELLAVTEQERLLDRHPVLQDSLRDVPCDQRDRRGTTQYRLMAR